MSQGIGRPEERETGNSQSVEQSGHTTSFNFSLIWQFVVPKAITIVTLKAVDYKSL